MKKFLSVFLLAVLCFGITATSVSAAPADMDTVSVTGRASTQLSPDIAYITIGVVTQDSTVELARNDNAKRIDKIVKGLLAYNIAQKDIQTANFNLRPVYSDNKDGKSRKVVGYSLENMLTIKVRDIKNTASVIDSAFANGANELGGINFASSQSEKVQKELLQQAVQDAEEKARLVANAGGRLLGRMVKANVNTQVSVYSDSRAYKSNAVMDSAAASQVFAGTLKFSADVIVVYELK